MGVHLAGCWIPGFDAFLSLKTLSPHLSAKLLGCDPRTGCRCVISLQWKLSSFTWHLNINCTRERKRKHDPLAWLWEGEAEVMPMVLVYKGARAVLNCQYVPWHSFDLCQLRLTHIIPRHSRGNQGHSQWMVRAWPPLFWDSEFSRTAWPQGKEPFSRLC